MPASAADSIPLYDVDFSSPTHAVNSAPSTGSAPAPRETPTTIRSQPVTVVPAYGDLTDQPAAFPGTRRGDMTFSLAGMPVQTSYRLAMNVVVDSDLRILISAPGTNVIHFQAGGNVVVIIRNAATGSQETTVVATYTPGDGQAHALEAYMDIENDVFELTLDGVVVHLATFGAQAALTQFRVFGTYAAVDDIELDDGADVTEIAATLDIRPGSEGPAPVNLRSRGVVPMAILGSEDLDVLTVDEASLGVLDAAGEALAVAPRRVAVCDVNDDGIEDLMLHVSTVQLVGAGVLSATTTALTVVGQSLDGTPLRGADDVRVLEHCRRAERPRVKESGKGK